MIEAPISTILAGLAAGVLVGLSLPVSFRRIATKTHLGAGDDPLLQRLIRAQGNYVEFVPIGLIAIFLVEIGGAAANTVWMLGGLLAAGRLFHAAGMIIGFVPGRMVGMMLTYASLMTSVYYLFFRT